MNRTDFRKVMSVAIKLSRKDGGFSCIDLRDAYEEVTELDRYDMDDYQIIKDYTKMFKPDRSDKCAWLERGPYKLGPERIGMLELFREVALASKLYERY